MKKFFLLFVIILTLFSSCSSYVHSEYLGYEYVINEGENLYRTYSFYGDKAITILKDEVKNEYDDSLFYVTSHDELERITNTQKLKDILGKDVFGSYYLGLCQRSDDFDSIYALNCAYDINVKIQPTYSGSGWVSDDDFYLEVNRYFTSRRNDPAIIRDYVLDIILLPKNRSNSLYDVYDVERKIDHYENNLIVKKENVEYLYNKNTDSYSVYKINKDDFEIKNLIRNKPVDRIMDHTFYYNQNLKSIKIPSNIRKIGNSCFQGCLNLKEVIFEENSNLEVIGTRAFSLTFIRKIKIPSSVKLIKDGAFGYCTNLSKVEFEKDSRLKEIEEKSFFKCLSLSSIVIPSLVQSIGDKAFYSSYLTHIYLPISLINLGDDVFSEEKNSGLTIMIDYEGENIPSSWSNYFIVDRNYIINCKNKSEINFTQNKLFKRHYKITKKKPVIF